MQEETPPMSAALLGLFQYNRQTPFGDQLLLGTAPYQPSVDTRTTHIL